MSDTTIAAVKGRRVWDSRGRPTVEAEIELAGGARGRAISPAGASMGAGEAVDRRDGGSAFGGLGVTLAMNAVNSEIAGALRGRDAADQHAIDKRLIALDGTPNKARLGGNAIIAVSMAAAHAAAAARGLPLWQHLGGDAAKTIPLPEIQIFGGGAHAGGRLDVQDFMVICPGARSFAQALDWTAEVYRAAGALMKDEGRLRGVADEGGYWPEFDGNEQALAMLLRAIERAGYAPGEQVAISLDIAASQFGKRGRYRLARDRRDLDSDAWGEVLLRWIERYPIRMIEDPMAEDDPEGFAHFTSAVKGRVQVVADDLVVTSAQRIADMARRGAGDAALIKPNQAGTLTEAKAALDAARDAGWGAIVSARSGESEDVTIAHLAVGWGVGQFKVGSFTRSERMAKWNEMLRIEEALGARAKFAGKNVLP
ncbi:MAG: phosphopyruvate hydratase [Alphaproteobacteria bacterium]|nr:phosphopyruvate hydratase [Alphaproteobacteria bacterium]